MTTTDLLPAKGTELAASTTTSLRHRLADRGIDSLLWLLVPAVAFTALLFLYPFIYGLMISLQPMQGGSPFADYQTFFSDPYLRGSIWVTLKLALPASLISVGGSVPLAYRMRKDFPGKRVISLLFLLPVTFGSVLMAEGMLQIFSPHGWVSMISQKLGFGQLHVLFSFNGVLLALVLSTLPFAFLMTLGFVSGIDPSLEAAAATLGASRAARFWKVTFPLLVPGLTTAFSLVFVLAFAVFPAAVLIGQPDSSTHVLSIPIYEYDAQKSDFPMASAISVIMTVVELIVLTAVALLRKRLYSGPATTGKG